MKINKLACSSSSSSTSSNQENNNLHSFVDQIATTISFKFNQCLQLNQTNNSNHSHANDDDTSDEEEFVDCEDNEDDDNNSNNNNHEPNRDFTFMYINENNSQSKKRQTNSALPNLFDENLLSKQDDDGENQLPIQPHVDNVFIKSPDQRAPSLSSSSSTSEYDDSEGVAVGPYRTWSKQQQHAKENVELNKKSNSTGFSKLWRLKGKVGRSNSDGRDAFVFLRRPPAAADHRKTSKMVVKRTAVGGSLVKTSIDDVDGAKTKVVKIGTKAQNANVSAHEVYLRKKEQTEEERRRSYYLPYRPEIMGFFTNINGGCLTKNLHPY